MVMTTRDVIKIIINVDKAYLGVKYNDKRAILNNMDVPLIAYAYCYGNAFVMLRDNKGKGKLVSYCISVLHPLSKYYTCSAMSITNEKCLSHIKNNSLVAVRNFDEKEITKAMKEVNTRYSPRMIGKITFKKKEKDSYDDYTYTVFKQKNGKLSSQKSCNKYEYTKWITNKTFLYYMSEYLKKIDEYEVTDNDQIMEQIKQAIMLERL